ncbi:unnamed protein product [Ilex paraguariensis]|uniref:Uncharacterized protein n=1 Tax=Ilex paraguariensis TaxID=185542 RepID=A0ABC8UZW5_9AQUA
MASFLGSMEQSRFGAINGGGGTKLCISGDKLWPMEAGGVEGIGGGEELLPMESGGAELFVSGGEDFLSTEVCGAKLSTSGMRMNTSESVANFIQLRSVNFHFTKPLYGNWSIELSTGVVEELLPMEEGKKIFGGAQRETFIGRGE